MSILFPPDLEHVVPADLVRLFDRLHGPDWEEARAAAEELCAEAGRARAGAPAPKGRPIAQDTRAPVVVSACLLGFRCRYDGASKPYAPLLERLGYSKADAELPSLVPLCPEVLAGLGVPRPPVSFIEGSDGDTVVRGDGRLVATDGRDATEAFLRGARRATQLAALCGASRALLKEGSPSCGVLATSCRGRRVPGRGVFAAMLHSLAFSLQSDEHPDEAAHGDKLL